MTDLKQKVVHGTIWALAERFSTQFVSFFVTLVLARLLTPQDYGTVALLSIFMAIAGELVDSGLGSALIQKRDATEADFNTVFYLSIVFSGLLYVTLYFTAPLIADFYKVPVLIPILRVLAVTLFFNAINSVQNAELNRKLLFHLSFRISLISSVVAAGTGVAFAAMGYGGWALVWSQVASGFAGVISRWFFIAWRPRLMFSFSALGRLWRYGWKLVAASLLDRVYDNFQGLLIGKFYSPADLAFVNKGEHTPRITMDPISGTLSRVAFPVFAKVQDDKERFRLALERLVRMSAFLIFPLMVGCALCAHELVLLLFGEKWLPCVPYLQIGCFAWAWMPIHSLNIQATKAAGRSDLFLWISLAKKCIGLVAVVISIRYGVLIFVLVTSAAIQPFNLVMNVWPNRSILGYSIIRQLLQLVPSLLISIVMGAMLYGVDIIGSAFTPRTEIVPYAVATLCTKIVLGVGVYFVLSRMLRVEALGEMLELIQARKLVTTKKKL